MQETFPLYDQDKELAGEGLYVSATTSSNKRYYGVLVDQQALKVASTMYFQDQSDSLKLNERMKLLLEEKPAANSASQIITRILPRAVPFGGAGQLQRMVSPRGNPHNKISKVPMAIDAGCRPKPIE